MNNTSQVARFIADRIEACGQKQKDIAEKVGFETPNMITMIKQGKTKLPLDKVVAMAKALETPPEQLMQMCFEEYHPSAWAAFSPLLAPTVTEDERRLLDALRAWVGGPFLSQCSQPNAPLS